jgi:hypothetical protein
MRIWIGCFFNLDPDFHVLWSNDSLGYSTRIQNHEIWLVFAYYQMVLRN